MSPGPDGAPAARGADFRRRDERVQLRRQPLPAAAPVGSPSRRRSPSRSSPPTLPGAVGGRTASPTAAPAHRVRSTRRPSTRAGGAGHGRVGRPAVHVDPWTHEVRLRPRDRDPGLHQQAGPGTDGHVAGRAPRRRGAVRADPFGGRGRRAPVAPARGRPGRCWGTWRDSACDRAPDREQRRQRAGPRPDGKGVEWTPSALVTPRAGRPEPRLAEPGGGPQDRHGGDDLGQDRGGRWVRRREDDLRRVGLRDRPADHRGRDDRGQRGRTTTCRPPRTRPPPPWPWTSAASRWTPT